LHIGVEEATNVGPSIFLPPFDDCGILVDDDVHINMSVANTVLPIHYTEGPLQMAILRRNKSNKLGNKRAKAITCVLLIFSFGYLKGKAHEEIFLRIVETTFGGKFITLAHVTTASLGPDSKFGVRDFASDLNIQRELGQLIVRY